MVASSREKYFKYQTCTKNTHCLNSVVFVASVGDQLGTCGSVRDWWSCKLKAKFYSLMLQSLKGGFSIKITAESSCLNMDVTQMEGLKI